jgi:antitoxin FitA
MRACMSASDMPKTIQTRDVGDETYEALAARAAREGLSVPELVRRELTRIAALPSELEWLESVQRPAAHSHIDTVALLDEVRGEWLDARK